MGRVVIIGGGIAGVSAAAELARRGHDLVLLEQEAQLGTQSSGRSAAIFRLAVGEELNVRLALRSRELGLRAVPGGTVRALGGLYPCDDDEARRHILEAGTIAGVRPATTADYPSPIHDRARPAIYSPGDGVIDTHALLHGLAAEARAAGARFVFDTPIDALVSTAGRITGVRSGSAEWSAELVIDATGAWSPQLPGVPSTGIEPARRHLFVLDSPWRSAFTGVVWDLTEALYLRPESGGLLASPCDQSPMRASTHVPSEAEATALLFEKLSRWAPELANASVRTSWAGLRPLTRDHRFVVGPDPRAPGLFRLGGFGGHGMTAGAAAGELAARMISGEEAPEAHELRPERFYLAG